MAATASSSARPHPYHAPLLTPSRPLSAHDTSATTVGRMAQWKRTASIFTACLLALVASPLVAAQSQPQPNPCFRWSGMMAIANARGGGGEANTLYYYGGEAQTSERQQDDTWTNALVSLSLAEDWPTGTPPIQLVQNDNGNYSFPPAVTLGALWASADGQTLYQYAGSYSDSPPVSPPEQRTFAYSIQDDQWSVIETSGDDVGNVAEGQPAIVPGQGENGENVGYYSHGHQDFLTTNGWSNQIARIYLNSLVRFDMGSRQITNITSYSSAAQTSNSSTPLTNPVSRADGTLTYVPNLGTNGKGILVSIGGATSEAYVDNSVLDVYDIGAQGWTRQATGGETMDRRVNHCAVRASAKVNGVQVHHIITYGGQQLNQSERDSSVYILTIQEDSYTWSFAGNDLAGQPNGRAGHQGNQLIVVGGVTRDDVICEQPGVFVFNTSSLTWQSQYKAGTVFSTPELVADLVGGIGTGYSSSGAGSAQGGDGSSDPDTSGSSGDRNGGGGGGSNNDGSGGSGGGGGTNVGAIAGGVVGGVVGLALLALLAFCLIKRKKKQRQKEEERAAEKMRLAGRSDSGSSGGRFAGFAFPGEKGHRMHGSVGSEFPPSSMQDFAHRREQERRGSFVDGPGPLEGEMDDPEHEFLGRDTFVATGLAPRRELRVVNADD
ncbi:hypothetical protein JCM11251_000031 [Rhodosporidiobolus azoricus]